MTNEMGDSRCDNGKYKGVTVLVLGAAGFVGRWVARELSRIGANLHLVVRDRCAAEPIFARYDLPDEPHVLDLRDDAGIRALFDLVRPAITFNLAGYGVDRSERDERTARRMNDELLGVLAASAGAARDDQWAGRSLVHTGSALEYGEARGNLVETTTPRPTTLYGRTKLAGTERLAAVSASCGVRAVTARVFTVYGPGEHAGRLLPSLLEAARSDAPLALSAGTQKRDFTYVEDVVEGLLRLGLSVGPPGETVNLATGRMRTVREFVEAAARLLQISAARLQFGAVPIRSEEMQHEPVCIRRLRERVGWGPATGLVDGIRRTKDFLKS